MIQGILDIGDWKSIFLGDGVESPIVHAKTVGPVPLLY